MVVKTIAFIFLILIFLMIHDFYLLINRKPFVFCKKSQYMLVLECVDKDNPGTCEFIEREVCIKIIKFKGRPCVDTV